MLGFLPSPGDDFGLFRTAQGIPGNKGQSFQGLNLELFDKSIHLVGFLKFRENFTFRLLEGRKGKNLRTSLRSGWVNIDPPQDGVARYFLRNEGFEMPKIKL